MSEEASGAHIRESMGCDYIDFPVSAIPAACAAMRPEACVDEAALRIELKRGATTMMPTED